MAETLRMEILKHFCYHREKLLILFGMLAVFFLLTIGGFWILTPGSSAYVINLLNFIALGVMLIVFGTMLYFCFRTDFKFR